ncbi:MAG: hypothetical protein HYU85_02570 [Chloroflexi bacterium]|nr:hypothetical protein [Chloroflexota bacterium]
MCSITWLVKQLFIKLGWLEESDAGDGCGLPAVKVNYSQQGQRNERPIVG